MSGKRFNEELRVKSSRIVWSCPWYQVRQDLVINKEGEDSTYNVVVKPAAVWILPVTEDGDIVLIKNYRHTVKSWCWEIPAGNQLEGISLRKSAEIELKEEVGGVTKNIEYIGKFYAASGICNETSHLFLATGVILEEPNHEVTEIIEIHCKSVSETLNMVRANLISSGPSALALFLCEERLRQL